MHIPNFGFEVPERDGKDSTADGGPASKDAERKAATALKPMGDYTKNGTEDRSRSKLQIDNVVVSDRSCTRENHKID